MVVLKAKNRSFLCDFFLNPSSFDRVEIENKHETHFEIFFDNHRSTGFLDSYGFLGYEEGLVA